MAKQAGRCTPLLEAARDGVERGLLLFRTVYERTASFSAEGRGISIQGGRQDSAESCTGHTTPGIVGGEHYRCQRNLYCSVFSLMFPAR